VFDRYCAVCHEAYSSKPLKGPSLQGMFKKPFMPSGAPANDDRVREVIALGRSKMPAFGRVLNLQQMDDLLAYLHTL
jgi:mono/diheme cytochrome c family protein